MSDPSKKSDSIPVTPKGTIVDVDRIKKDGYGIGVLLFLLSAIGLLLFRWLDN